MFVLDVNGTPAHFYFNRATEIGIFINEFMKMGFRIPWKDLREVEFDPEHPLQISWEYGTWRTIDIESDPVDRANANREWARKQSEQFSNISNDMRKRPLYNSWEINLSDTLTKLMTLLHKDTHVINDRCKIAPLEKRITINQRTDQILFNVSRSCDTVFIFAGTEPIESVYLFKTNGSRNFLNVETVKFTETRIEVTLKRDKCKDSLITFDFNDDNAEIALFQNSLSISITPIKHVVVKRRQKGEN